MKYGFHPWNSLHSTMVGLLFIVFWRVLKVSTIFGPVWLTSKLLFSLLVSSFCPHIPLFLALVKSSWQILLYSQFHIETKILVHAAAFASLYLTLPVTIWQFSLVELWNSMGPYFCVNLHNFKPRWSFPISFIHFNVVNCMASHNQALLCVVLFLNIWSCISPVSFHCCSLIFQLL